MDPPKLDRDEILARYDHLHAAGELLYTPSSATFSFTIDNFPFEFRIAPSQKSKPIFPEDSKPHPPPLSNGAASSSSIIPTDEEARSDIDNGNPKWHLAHVHDTHRVILNKYCIFRPQYLLMTASAAHLQTSPLEFDDFRAAWTMLGSLDGPHYVIFNCAKAAGGSRMHKHMQVFEQGPDELLPDMILRDDKIKKSVPFQYRLEQLPSGQSGEDVAAWLLQTYQKHVTWCAEVLGLPKTGAVVPHNIVLTKRWLITIPRREAGVGRATANAAGMLGWVWVSEEPIIQLWKELGPRKVLATVGVAAEGMETVH